MGEVMSAILVPGSVRRPRRVVEPSPLVRYPGSSRPMATTYGCGSAPVLHRLPLSSQAVLMSGLYTSARVPNKATATGRTGR